MSVTRCPNDKISRILRLKVLWWEVWLSTEISIIGLPLTVSAFRPIHGSIPSGPEWVAIFTAYFAEHENYEEPRTRYYTINFSECHPFEGCLVSVYWNLRSLRSVPEGRVAVSWDSWSKDKTMSRAARDIKWCSRYMNLMCLKRSDSVDSFPIT